MGLRLEADDGVVAAWDFNEPATSVPPSCRPIGALPDLTVPAGLTTPTIVSTSIGRGRQFGNIRVFTAADALDKTRLRRTMSIEAIVTLDYARANNGLFEITSRGLDDGTSKENTLWGFYVSRNAAPSLTMGIRWFGNGFHENVFSTVDLLSRLPATGNLVQLGVCRRWISATSLEVSFYLNGAIVETVAGVDGAIEGGVGGTMIIGARGVSGGTSNYFRDVIDEIRFFDREVTQEEFELSYKRIFVLPGQGGELIRAVQPPGQTYSRNPTSAVQRVLSVEGDALAIAWSKLSELREDFLPDRAHSTLGRWEDLTGQKPGPADMISDRRERVQQFLRKIHGYSRRKIKDLMAVPFDLDAADVQIIENTNALVDDFAGSAPHDRWLSHPQTNATITVTGGYVELATTGAATIPWTESLRTAAQLRTSIPIWHLPDGTVEGHAFEAIAKVTNHALTTNGFYAGIAAFRTFRVPFTTDAIIFGLRRNGSGVIEWFHRTISSGVVTSASAAAVPGGFPYWLRLRRAADGSTMDMSWSSVSEAGPWTDIWTAIGGFGASEISWVGPAIFGDNSIAAGNSLRVDEMRFWFPTSRWVYQWYAYRDPLLPGAPKMADAQLLLNKAKPAHTRGYACQSLSLLCDDAYNLCDRDPLGV